MAEVTGISWTDHTFNPWSGCVKVSRGCKFCYAERESVRHGLKIFGPASTTQRQHRAESYWRAPVRWNAAALDAQQRRRVFCASFADVFEDNPDPMLLEARRRLFALIEETPALDWQVLTKRPENIAEMIEAAGFEHWLEEPRPNVWLGTSVEDSQVLERIEYLVDVPAAVRFLSVEPMVGPVSPRPWLYRTVGGGMMDLDPEEEVPYKPGECPIDWVIVGGESGPQAAPMHPDWARTLRDECEAAGVAFFFKQWGRWSPGASPGARHIALNLDGSRRDITFDEASAALAEPDVSRGTAIMHSNASKVHGVLDGVEHHAFPRDANIMEVQS